jgi:hypothetical protein
MAFQIHAKRGGFLALYFQVPRHVRHVSISSKRPSLTRKLIQPTATLVNRGTANRAHKLIVSAQMMVLLTAKTSTSV